EALALAKSIAQLPREILQASKRAFNKDIMLNMERVYADELAMHAKTFVGKQTTLNTIQQNFSTPTHVSLAKKHPDEFVAGTRVASLAAEEQKRDTGESAALSS